MFERVREPPPDDGLLLKMAVESVAAGKGAGNLGEKARRLRV